MTKFLSCDGKGKAMLMHGRRHTLSSTEKDSKKPITRAPSPVFFKRTEYAAEQDETKKTDTYR